MMGKYQLFIYVCMASSAYAEDLTCQTGTKNECVKADLCPQFVKDRQQLKSFARGSTLYNNLLSRLKRHICNKVEKKVCCNKGKGRTTEIAYGTTVDYAIAKKSYPFMARIILDGSKCGGALISDRFVATARHCLEFCSCFNEANPSNDWTRCNDCLVKLRENSEFISDTETVHIIKTIHLPENSGKPYETRGQRTDFALIELAESANICTQEETTQVRCWPVTPVRLPDPSFHMTEGQRVRTLGWGATEFSFGDEQSEFLAQLDITVNSSTLFHFLIETNIGPNGADPCKGDSGGPLLLRGDDLEWTLVGTLLGGGYQCENPGGNDTTSDWNKITLHVPWITSVMGTTTVDKPEFPSAFNISSTGGTKEDYPSYLGLFTMTTDTYHNEPVYKHKAEELYLFLASNNNWSVYTKPNPHNVALVKAPKGSTSNLPPTSGWEYLPSDKDDSTASVLAVQGSASFNISSSGGIKDKYPTALGLYTQDGDRMYNDHPVYKHKNQSLFLFLDGYGDWRVNSELDKPAYWFYSRTKSVLPPATGWIMYTGSWTSDPSLTVRGVWGRMG